MAHVAEGDDDPTVWRVAGDVTITGQRTGQFSRLRPGLAFVVGEDDHRIEASAVFAQQAGELLAVRRPNDSRFAQVRDRMPDERLGRLPGESTVGRQCLIDGKSGRLAGVSEEAAIVMEERHIGAVAEPDDVSHRHDPAVVADRRQWRPGSSLVFGDRHADRIEPRKHHQPFDSFGIDHSMQRRRFLRSGPVLGNVEPVGPVLAAVLAPLEDDGAAPMALGVRHQYRLAVVEQHGAGVTEVLTRFLVDHHLPIGLVRQVDQRDRVAARRGLVLGFRRDCEKR